MEDEDSEEGNESVWCCCTVLPTILDKIPWKSNAVFIIFYNFRVLS